MNMKHYRAMMFKNNRIRMNHLSEIKGIHLVKTFLLSGFSLSVAVLIFIFFYRIFDYLKTVDIFGEMLTIRLITMVFLSFFSMLIFSNILTSISVFYIAKDVEFLLSTPIKTGVIYYFKFTETIFHSSIMIMMFGIPVFAAYGFVYDAKLPFYLLAFLVFIPFLVIPAAFGASITQLLMRFLPAKRTHQVMLALGAFFLVIMIMFIRFLEPEKLLSPMGAQLFTEYLEKMRIPAPYWLPSTMTAEAIVSACKGEFDKFIFFFLTLSVIAIAFYLISSKIATNMYRKGWDDSKILKPRTDIRKSSNIPIFFINLFKFLNTKTAAMIEKEVKFFLRDTSQWSQLFLLGALVLIYIFNIVSIPVESKFMHNALAFFNICLACFVLSGVAVRFSFPSISMEGRAFWVIQSSPVSLRNFVLIKFFIYFIPQVILAELIVIISNYILDVSDFMFYFTMVSVFIITGGLSGLGVGLGSIYPDFKADSPERVAISAGGIIYMITAVAYILIMILLLASPIYSYFASKLNLANISNTWVFSSYVLSLVLSAAICVIPLKLGIKRLRDIEI